MKKTITLLFILNFFTIAHAQYCTSNTRFTEAPFFSHTDVTSLSNQTYAQAINYQGNTETLDFNIYFPKMTVDTMAKRPLVVMVHGGGLITGLKSDMNQECYQFARRGFVAATIKYRLGVDCNNDNLSNDKAAYRAVQDLHAALRYFMANSASLKIDTSWIFIGGGSAGSSTCHRLLYVTQAEWNSYSPTLQSVLGSINTSGNNLTNTFTIKGFMNNWGGIQKGMAQTSEMKPTVSFHGGMDTTVPIDSANGFSCNIPISAYGSRTMHNKLINSGICSELSVEPTGGHGIYQDSIGTVIRVGRTSCFFKSVFCNNCSNYYSTSVVAANCSTTTGIWEASGELANGNVFPNPFTNTLSFSLARGHETYELYNSVGKVIYSGKLISEQDFSSLPPGVYLVKISDNFGRFAIHTVIKQ